MQDRMEASFSEQSKRLEEAMSVLVEDLDKSHLRKMHAEMHMCASKCCQRKDDSLEAVYNCVEKCRLPVDQAWSLVENEMHLFHENLSNCLENCSAKTKWLSSQTDPELTRSSKEIEECTGKCIDKMIHSIPALLERMRGSIQYSSIKKPIQQQNDQKI